MARIALRRSLNDAGEHNFCIPALNINRIERSVRESSNIRILSARLQQYDESVSRFRTALAADSLDEISRVVLAKALNALDCSTGALLGSTLPLPL